MGEATEVPARVQAMLDAAVRRRAAEVEARRVFAGRRAVGLRRRHAVKAARTR